MIEREEVVLPQAHNIVGTVIHENGIKGARTLPILLVTCGAALYAM